MILGKNPRSLPFYYQQQFEFFLHPRSLQPQAQGSVPGEQKMQSFAPGALTSNVNIHHKHAHLLQLFTSHIDMGILVIDCSFYATLAMRVSSWSSVSTLTVTFWTTWLLQYIVHLSCLKPKDGCWKWNTYNVQIELTQCLRFHLLLSTAFPHAEHVRVFPPDNLYF